MNLSDLVLGDQADDSVRQVARQFDLSETEARAAMQQILPALQRGMQRNSEVKGLDELLAAIEDGNHSRYVEEPTVLGNKATTDDGNGILGHIFGSKEVSRNVATHASAKTGLSSSLLKKLLPVVATIAMGSLSKKVLGGSNRRAPARSQSRGIIASILDSDNDGSVIDDVLGMAWKIMV